MVDESVQDQFDLHEDRKHQVKGVRKLTYPSKASADSSDDSSEDSPSKVLQEGKVIKTIKLLVGLCKYYNGIADL